MSGILYIISAPSGSGKSTLVNELRTIVGDLEFSISYTTRPPRGSEPLTPRNERSDSPPVRDTQAQRITGNS